MRCQVASWRVGHESRLGAGPSDDKHLPLSALQRDLACRIRRAGKLLDRTLAVYQWLRKGPHVHLKMRVLPDDLG
jgi:hypothetical protein